MQKTSQVNLNRKGSHSMNRVNANVSYNHLHGDDHLHQDVHI